MYSESLVMLIAIPISFDVSSITSWSLTGFHNFIIPHCATLWYNDNMGKLIENDYRLDNLNTKITPENIRKALSDPEFFLANYQQIVNKERQTVPFRLNAFQKMLFSLVVPKIASATRLNRRHNIVICKGRQQGASVSIVALINYICAFLDNTNNLVCLHTFPVGQTISKFYARKVQPIISGVHPDLYPTMERDNLGTSMITTYKDIKGIRRNNIYELVSANASSIRSDSVHLVIMDECGFYRNPYQLEAAIAPAIPDMGFSLVIYVSTFDDKNDFFKNKIITARDNLEDWTLIFAPWFMTYPEVPYGIDYKQLELSEYASETIIPAMREYGVPPEEWGDKIVWYNKKYTELGKVNTFKEYPTTIDEVLAYGEDRCVFQKESLDAQEKNILPGTPMRMVTDNSTGKVEAQETDISPFVMYKRPIYGHRYRIAIDPITAQSEDTDYFAMQVFDLSNNEQVAVFRERGLQDEDYADWAVSIGTIYNKAELCPEINVAQGFIVAVNARRYFRWFYQHKKAQKDRTPGLRTTVSSKELFIDRLNAMLDRESVIIHDKETLNELRNFVKIIKKRTDGTSYVRMAARGKTHDDLCMSLAIMAGSLDSRAIEGRRTSSFAII